MRLRTNEPKQPKQLNQLSTPDKFATRFANEWTSLRSTLSFAQVAKNLKSARDLRFLCPLSFAQVAKTFPQVVFRLELRVIDSPQVGA